VARTRKRFWAKTLTLTAALLAVVWVGSIWRGVNLIVTPSIMLFLSPGSVGWTYQDDPARPLKGPRFRIMHSAGLPTTWWFEHGRMDFPNGTSWSIWYGSLWPFVLLTGVPGVWMLIKTRKHANPHACPACGYDRTGLPQSPTGPAPCPECGKSV
jgi:predicted RNA-binding Zn-ribbon protein involved in translation (DUF1610 family)